MEMRYQMQVTAIEGVVENGQIRLQENISLAENTKVYVIVADNAFSRPARIYSPKLAVPEQASDFRKQVVDIFSDI
jgi:hypothetical protein